jgi:hypothetical protein
MKQKLLRPFSLLFMCGVSNFSFAQDTISRTLPPGYDPHYDKVIPDKIFEIGLPLLVLFFLANAIVAVIKIKEENRLKQKAIERGISEPTLIALFSEAKFPAAYQYLKWFLVLLALGLAFLSIQILATFYQLKSGYWALGILFLFLSFSFLTYYNFLRKR